MVWLTNHLYWLFTRLVIGPLPPGYIAGWANISMLEIRPTGDRFVDADGTECGVSSSIPRQWTRKSMIEMLDLRWAHVVHASSVVLVQSLRTTYVHYQRLASELCLCACLLAGTHYSSTSLSRLFHHHYHPIN
jgi:hypothetical protein